MGLNACYGVNPENEKAARKSLKKDGTYIGYKGRHRPHLSEDEISKEIDKLLKQKK